MKNNDMTYSFALQGFNEKDTAFVRGMMQILSGRLGVNWELLEDGTVTLVDIDTQKGQTFWKSRPKQQSIIAFGKKNIFNAHYYLSKPLRMQMLVDLFKQLGDELVENSASKNEIAWSFNLKDYFAGLLKDSMDSKEPVYFSFNNMLPLFFMPETKCCYTTELDLSNPGAVHKIVFSAHASKFDRQTISYEEANKAISSQSLKAYPVETILWLATLSISRGRQNEKLVKRPCVRLTQWPNFSKLPSPPEYSRLSGFMLQQMADVKTIGENTGLSMTQVVDFCNACEALGLLEYSQAQQVKKIKTRQQGLLKSIWNRFIPSTT